MDILSSIISMESGDLTEEEKIDCYRILTRTGMIWSLSNNHIEEATALIDAGIIDNTPENVKGDVDLWSIYNA